ncbi:hypothetical protein TPE24SN_0312a [Treponema pallidum subsp. pertenue]|nr:hypothetical protein TPE24SN_0312a [Treponema pallidum subsp. pertenue]
MRAMRAGRQVQGVVSFCVCAGGRVRGLLDRAGGGVR